MAKNTSIWLAGLSAAALISGAALAQDSGQKMNEAGAHAEQAGEKSGEALEQASKALKDAASGAAEATQEAGENVAEAAGDAADATGEVVTDAAEATGDAVREGAQETAEAAEETGDAIQEGASETVEIIEDTGDDVATAANNAADRVEDSADMDSVAVGDQEGTPVAGQIFEQSADTFLASSILDATIVNAAGEEVGDVNDLVITSDGMITGVVFGVGGFLGVGEKNVALEMGRLNVQMDEDGDMQFTINETEEALENAPEFVTAEEQRRERDRAAATTQTPAAPITTPAQ